MSALYLISDVHLGLQTPSEEAAKQTRLLALLTRLESDAGRLCILGDLFDFWFEYRHVVPASTLPVLAALQRLTRAGVEVHYLAGNHDFALGRFLTDEIGCTIHLDPVEMTFDGARFYLHHGDGLAGRDLGYRVLKRILRNRLLQRLWRWVHPDLGFALARRVSRTSRRYTGGKEYGPSDRRDRTLAALAGRGYDWIVMGHTHEPEVQRLAGGTVYLNLGSWLEGGAPHARFSGGEMIYERADGTVVRPGETAPL